MRWKPRTSSPGEWAFRPAEREVVHKWASALARAVWVRNPSIRPCALLLPLKGVRNPFHLFQLTGFTLLAEPRHDLCVKMARWLWYQLPGYVSGPGASCRC